MKPDRKITVMEGKIDLKQGHKGLEAGYKTLSLGEHIKGLKKKELDQWEIIEDMTKTKK